MTSADVIGLAIDILMGAVFIWLGMKFSARVIAGMQPGASYCSWWEILVSAAADQIHRGYDLRGRIAATVVGIWVLPFLPSWD